MPAHRTLSDAPRRSRRLSKQKPKMYDYDGFECYDQDYFASPRFPSESADSSYDEQDPPVFTNPFLTTSPSPSPVYESPKRGSTSHSRQRSEDHVPRPPNAFILFRSDYWKREKLHVEEEREKDHREISRLAARTWNELPAEQKEYYKNMALIKKAEHARRYPGYKYAPSHRTKPKPARKKSARSSAAEIRACREIAEKIMRGHQLTSMLFERTPTPTLCSTTIDHSKVKQEEQSLPSDLLTFSPAPSTRSSPTPPPTTPRSLVSATDDSRQEEDSLVYPEEEDADADADYGGFVPTELIPELDLDATDPPAQTPDPEIKSAVPQYPSEPTTLPLDADIDTPFGNKHHIYSLQLEPSQVLLTDCNGHSEVSSFASDGSLVTGWGSAYETPSTSTPFNSGLYHDYSGSLSGAASSCDVLYDPSQSGWTDLDRMFNEQNSAYGYFQSHPIY
ncbi:hypothetical protein VNI00_014353 [Paramarasmius palmivorus]|uniref:HMG box domain-containing protein n=1 Tax=Paramarasmius palmivorus TaxID=297713 RepID=A0AAW0BRP0_9AGAR